MLSWPIHKWPTYVFLSTLLHSYVEQHVAIIASIVELFFLINHYNIMLSLNNVNDIRRHPNVLSS
jgi:hypothetical protein